VKTDILIVGDFNFPEIDQDSCYSVTNSYGSTAFLNTLHKLSLLRHVNFPTRACGTNTPHLLDLVITDDNFIQKMELELTAIRWFIDREFVTSAKKIRDF